MWIAIAFYILYIYILTRMHSTSMCTAHTFTVLPCSLLPWGCGYQVWPWRGDQFPPPRSPPLTYVTPLPIRTCDLSHYPFHVTPLPPWGLTEWVTHACENITFSLFATRAVKINLTYFLLYSCMQLFFSLPLRFFRIVNLINFLPPEILQDKFQMKTH